MDLFAGGFNVGINIDSNKVICNDCNKYLIELYKYLKETPLEDILDRNNNIISKYNLTKYNEEGYYNLREDFNRNKKIADFMTLAFFSFNHQIRFNNSYNFNSPFGKNRSSYNKRIENNLIVFIKRLKEKDIVFSSYNFTDIDLTSLTDKDFVYLDPPYLISTSSYNDGKRGFSQWNENYEIMLLEKIDELNAKSIKFALSNVIRHKGLTNNILLDWSKKYNVYNVSSDYSNCNYRLKNRDLKTEEVIICNY